ncbi:MAG: hypothetical protein ACXAD7_28980 [Candidatus Kariarchaeaceae archaeon]|jgi:hypothetical protein
MSEMLFDYTGWRRALYPALRTFGYLVVLYLLMFIFLIVPLFILVELGAPSELYDVFGGTLVPVFMVFALFLAFFKVLDEERPGSIPLKIT